MAKKGRGIHSIRTKLLLAYLVLSLLPLAGLGTTLIIQQRDRVVASIKENLSSNSTLQWSSLMAKIHGEQDTLALLANDLGNNKMLVDNLPKLASVSTYQEGLQGPNGNDGVNAAINGDESSSSSTHGSLIKTFNYALTSDNNLKGVRLYTEYISSTLSNCVFPIQYSSTEISAYAACKTTPADTVWTLADGNLYAYHSVLSYSTTNLDMIGMLRFQIDLGQFLLGFDSTYLDNGYILADARGSIIGSRGLKEESKTALYSSLIASKTLGETDKDHTMGIVSQNEETGWYLAYFIDSSMLTGQVLSGVWTTGGIVIGSFLVTSLIAALFMRSFAGRINRLKEGAERVAAGDYDSEIEDHSGDELSELATSFNKMEGEVKKTLEDMVITQDGISRTFAEILEAKSGQSGHHVKRVSEYTGILAEEMGYSESEVHDIKIASMLHDVGKIMIPNSILDKPGKLTDEEYGVMRTHVKYGEDLLKNSPGEIMQIGAKIAGCHHERWDGKGYVKGLKGEEIPLVAQISSVADVFDALVSRRSYKPGWTFEDAYQEIVKGRGTQFAPRAVDAFIKRFDDFKKVAIEYRDEEVQAS